MGQEKLMGWFLVLCTLTATDCINLRYEHYRTEAECERRATFYDPKRDSAKVMAYCIREGTKQIDRRKVVKPRNS